MQALPVIPGWSEGPDLRCAIAHRGISRFSDVQLHIVVRCCASPRNDEAGSRQAAACVIDAIGRSWWMKQARRGPSEGDHEGRPYKIACAGALRDQHGVG